MTEYWVTFRIASNSTYQKRYDALIDAMIEARGENGSWADPTSFWIVGSELGISQFGKKLASALNSKTDLLVIRELSRNNSRYFGAVENLKILKEFLPDIKKL